MARHAYPLGARTYAPLLPDSLSPVVRPFFLSRTGHARGSWARNPALSGGAEDRLPKHAHRRASIVPCKILWPPNPISHGPDTPLNSLARDRSEKDAFNTPKTLYT